ncbi:DUF6482 family protein [uncultured Halopseudomonas sp.]|mgnify:CR=1 FL=1|uniref:DUF6482 family protein n=1 Tax=uncultured Halopseudomonas sp. TaxID=2901193 RepID=UPI0030EEBF46|tara:strand:+ start:12457 stop:12771 length:315 start_codon:yes stop_codon:yes gene_type:complete
MTLDDLHKLATEGQVIELNVLSHEGSIYLVEAVLDSRRDMLKKQLCDKRPWTFRSFEEARRALGDIPLETIDLIHHNVYDEIGPGGQGGSPKAPPMRLTYSLHS